MDEYQTLNHTKRNCKYQVVDLAQFSAQGALRRTCGGTWHGVRDVYGAEGKPGGGSNFERRYAPRATPVLHHVLRDTGQAHGRRVASRALER